MQIKARRKKRFKKLAKGEILMVNIGSTSTGARIHQVKGDLAKVILTSPVCTSYGEKLALSRRVDKHWRLIGWGKIRSGKTIRDEDGGESSSTTTPGGSDTLGSDKTLTPSDDLDELGRTVDAATSSMGNIDSTDSTSSTKTDDSDDIQKKKTKRAKLADEDEEEAALDDEEEEKTVSKKKVTKEKKRS